MDSKDNEKNIVEDFNVKFIMDCTTMMTQFLTRIYVLVYNCFLYFQPAGRKSISDQPSKLLTY